MTLVRIGVVGFGTGGLELPRAVHRGGCGSRARRCRDAQRAASPGAGRPLSGRARVRVPRRPRAHRAGRRGARRRHDHHPAGDAGGARPRGSRAGPARGGRQALRPDGGGGGRPRPGRAGRPAGSSGSTTTGAGTPTSRPCGRCSTAASCVRSAASARASTPTTRGRSRAGRMAACFETSGATWSTRRSGCSDPSSGSSRGLRRLRRPRGRLTLPLSSSSCTATGSRASCRPAKLNRVQERELRVYGADGSYISRSTDVQATSIFAGLRPVDDPWGWGREPEAAWGTLRTADGERRIPSEQGSYVRYYEQFAEAVRTRWAASGHRGRGRRGARGAGRRPA